ncbi:hypothetical protein B9G98_02044 [Wickerhamiella sorbophila]|uniref:Uncharacterized protein n=1 Tax=Wickerhamiella sorbophila TaxID=45607 RepID=A0A2T0FHG1_9ASCO|nr:hypothetical protein B9G98_02044 [Wickerhamiella sorbophila]PRT54424.1 hypothetical protein B9G98_02044 [Wickerhamiella sorbophila]
MSGTRAARQATGLFKTSIYTGTAFGAGFGAAYLTAEHKELDRSLTQGHPYVQKLEAEGFKVESSLMSVPKHHLPNMITTGAFHAGGLGLAPATLLVHPDGRHQTIFYLGKELRHEHPATWTHKVWRYLFGASEASHFGIGTTLLDEGLAQCAFPYLPTKYGVTATLDVHMRRSLPSDDYLVLVAVPGDHSGRKSSASGSLHALHGTKLGPELMSGRVLMVEPWYFKYLTWALPSRT